MEEHFNVPKFRQQFRQEKLGRYYSGWAHLAFSCFSLLGTSFFCFSRLENPTWSEWMILPFMLLFGNFAVYIIHKYLLHRRLPGMGAAYRRHTLEHHHYYTDEYLVFENISDFRILLFPPQIVIFVAFLWGPLMAWAVSLMWSWNAGYLFWLGHCVYFILYEIFHFTSHLPKDHWALRARPFRLMRDHHLLHHRPALMGQYNFNIVYPLADWLFGTKK